MVNSIDEFIDQDTGRPAYLITVLAESEEDKEELLRTIDGPLALTSYACGGSVLQFRIDLTLEPSDYSCMSSAAT